MITSKQRSYLRSLAIKLEPIFHVGKNGIEDSFLKQVAEALEARELIKIAVLDNSEYTSRQASDYICEKIDCDGVQSIGKKFVLYKKSNKNSKIELI
jgi:RNA-binding protein